jgi:hypothetical protein
MQTCSASLWHYIRTNYTCLYSIATHSDSITNQINVCFENVDTFPCFSGDMFSLLRQAQLAGWKGLAPRFICNQIGLTKGKDALVWRMNQCVLSNWPVRPVRKYTNTHTHITCSINFSRILHNVCIDNMGTFSCLSEWSCPPHHEHSICIALCFIAE